MWAVRACIAEGCGGANVVHCLPKNGATRKRWLTILNRIDLVDLPHSQLQNAGVCSNHFGDTAYKFAGSKQLHFGAEPKSPFAIEEAAPDSVVEEMQGECGNTSPELCADDVLSGTKFTYTRKRLLQDTTSTETPCAPCDDVAVTSPEKPSAPSGDVAVTSPEKPSAPSDDVAVTSPKKPYAPSGDVSVTSPDEDEAAVKSDRPDAPGDDIVPEKRRCTESTLTLVDLGVHRRSELSLREQELYGRIKRMEQSQRVANANRKKTNVKKGTASIPSTPSYSSSSLNVITSCDQRLQNCTSNKSHRYSSKEKTLFLSLYRSGPRCYRYLQKLIPTIPSTKTLQRTQSALKLKPGINTQLFDYLNVISQSKTPLNRYCTLMWDEMSLAASLQYTKDGIMGLEDYGSEKRPTLADHALVFMIRGIQGNWKQPVAFYFSLSAAKSATLKSCIKEVIQAIHENTEFRILASVCDMGPSNKPAIVGLAEDDGRPDDFIYNVNGHEIMHLFDVPHLIKCLRNNFMTKDIEFGGGLAKWDDLKTLYNLSLSSDHAGNATKLTLSHISPEGKKKMKVKLATQVFSRSVASSFTLLDNLLVSLGQPKRYKGTSEFVLFMNDLFDTLNSQTNSYKPLAAKVQVDSPHHKFWADALPKLAAMEFIQHGKTMRIKPPCIKGLIGTIRNVQSLWKRMAGLGFKHLCTRSLNQDPLENFFGCVRGLGGLNQNPSCSQFIAAYSTAIVNNTMRSGVGSNCEKDSERLLLNLEMLLSQSSDSPPPSSNSPPLLTLLPSTSSVLTSTASVLPSVVPPDFSTSVDKSMSILLKKSNSSYVAGFILKKVLNRDCQACVRQLTSEVCPDSHALIQLRDYGADQPLLIYPDPSFISSIHRLRPIIFDLIYKNITDTQIFNTILHHPDCNLRYYVTCPQHRSRINLFSKFILIKLLLHTFCNKVNSKINLKSLKPNPLIDKFLLQAYPPLQAKIRYYDKRILNRNSKPS